MESESDKPLATGARDALHASVPFPLCLVTSLWFTAIGIGLTSVVCACVFGLLYTAARSMSFVGALDLNRILVPFIYGVAFAALPAIAVPTLILTIQAMARSWLFEHRMNARKCRACDFPLSDSGTCSECGLRATELLRSRPPFHAKAAVAAATVISLAVLLALGVLEARMIHEERAALANSKRFYTQWGTAIPYRQFRVWPGHNKGIMVLPDGRVEVID